MLFFASRIKVSSVKSIYQLCKDVLAVLTAPTCDGVSFSLEEKVSLSFQENKLTISGLDKTSAVELISLMVEVCEQQLSINELACSEKEEKDFMSYLFHHETSNVCNQHKTLFLIKKLKEVSEHNTVELDEDEEDDAEAIIQANKNRINFR